jgi:murein DD-endopeptidase MepM/ murein hydrolase activator NlpD
MDQTYHLFVVFPGTHGKLRKAHVPLLGIRLVMALAIIGFVAAAVTAGNYARMLLKVSSYNSLRSELGVLRIQGNGLNSAVRRSHLKLESLQSLAADLALAYTFTDERRPQMPYKVLRVASRGLTGFGADYEASLCAFRMMKGTPLLSAYTSNGSPLSFASAFQDSDTPSLWPVRGPITAGFGQRMDPFTGEDELHQGIDIAAPSGTPVRVTADGILFHAGPAGTYGNEALIDHGYGITTKYAHLSRIYVKVGEVVHRGQIIGAVGVTGLTTGPHLHYEVLVQGTPVNPAEYLRD